MKYNILLWDSMSNCKAKTSSLKQLENPIRTKRYGRYYVSVEALFKIGKNCLLYVTVFMLASLDHIKLIFNPRHSYTTTRQSYSRLLFSYTVAASQPASGWSRDSTALHLYLAPPSHMGLGVGQTSIPSTWMVNQPALTIYLSCIYVYLLSAPNKPVYTVLYL